MRKISALALSTLLLSTSVIAQQKNIYQGLVLDKNGKPVPGATISIKGTKKVTSTDETGHYSIDVLNSNATLVISMVGAITQEVKAANNLTITLENGNQSLDEVMVVAYGTAKKSAFTGSAVVLSGSDIKSPAASFDKGIAGKVPGLQVISNSGQPGSATTFRIRGSGSLSASNQPLIVIDGVATTNDDYSQVASDASSSSNTLATLNPDDIESITVLKDAAAAALYGSRAANGVIVVTTKSGKIGKITATVSAKHASTSLAGKYDVMSSAELYKHLYTAYLNAGNDYQKANTLTQGQLTHNPYNVDYPLDENGNVVSGAKIVVNTDWQSSVYKSAPTNDLNASFNGGSEKTKYFFSLGGLDQKGIAPNSSYKRYSGNFNIQSNVNKWLKVGLNSIFSYSEQNTTTAGSAGASPLLNAIQFPNAVPIYQVDSVGSYVLDADGNKQFNFTNPVSLDFNPLAIPYMDVAKSKFYRLLASAFADVTILDGLNLKTVFSPNYISVSEHRYWNKDHGNGVAYNGRIDKYQTTDMQYTSTNTLNYNKQFGIHHLNVMGGMEYWQSSYNYLYAGGQDILGDMQELAAASTFFSSSSSTTKEVLISYFGRAEYAYSDRYNASFSLRTDGSSIFGDNNKWGTFWSTGFSWNAKRENFLKDVNWLDQAKLRISYGTSGNKSGIDRYASKGLWTVDADYKYLSNTGSVLTQLPNNNLSWESQKMFNIGIDFGFLDIFYGSFDYFNKTSSGLLYDYPLSIENGLSSVILNAAKTANYGFEASMGANIIKNGAFKWNASVNASIIKDKIKDLYGDDNVPQTSVAKMWSVGGSQYEFWMPTWKGVDRVTGSPLWAKVNDDGTETTTSTYSEANYQKQGRSTPKVYGGFTNELSYKNINLSFNVSYTLGGKVYDGLYAKLMHDGTTSGVNLDRDALNSWTKAGDVTNVPLYSINNASGSNSLSSRYLFDATNLRLRNVTLSYNLPSNLGVISKVITGGRVYVSGDNLFTLFKADWKGYQDIDIYGIQGYSLYPSIPTGRTFSFGVNLNF